jgi:DNA invertase Pin-like site-specific DNA recombinase
VLVARRGELDESVEALEVPARGARPELALIVDEDGAYEPRHPNDRLLLGMKGTMSELELSILRARSFEAHKQKARRGELFLTVAIGYVRAGRDRIEQDPDLRVREAIGLVFARFAEMQSIRQVHLSLRRGVDHVAFREPQPRRRARSRLEAARLQQCALDRD